jgi:hypothetical protein
MVLSNAGDDTEEDSGDGDSTNHDAREKLHHLGIDVTDRMLGKGHIGHNKFVVYAKGAKAKAVLCGSTNWTSTGLCAQSNNSHHSRVARSCHRLHEVLESKSVAQAMPSCNAPTRNDCNNSPTL